MSEDLELVRGSDNPFEVVGLPEADTKLIKANLAAEIIAILRDRQLTGAAAAKLAGVQTADMSCFIALIRWRPRAARPAGCPGISGGGERG